MKIANVYGIIKECRERIIKTMQERGMESIVFSPCKEDYDREHENDEEYVEWYDYLNDVCPNVVFFDKYNVGYEYTVLRVTLMGDQMEPYFTLDCFNSELGKAAFTSHHIYDMTPVYELLEKKLEIEDEESSIYVLTYVGLSASERGGDADGYCDAWVFTDQVKAEAKLQSLRNAEIEHCKDEGFDYNIVKDEPMEFRMGWGGGEEIRLQIQDTLMD